MTDCILLEDTSIVAERSGKGLILLFCRGTAPSAADAAPPPNTDEVQSVFGGGIMEAIVGESVAIRGGGGIDSLGGNPLCWGLRRK